MIAAFSLMVGGAGRKWGIDAKLATPLPDLTPYSGILSQRRWILTK